MLFCRHLLLIKFNYLENNDIKKKRFFYLKQIYSILYKTLHG